MITLEKAIEIAKNAYKGFDHYRETHGAFIFDESEHDGDGGFGAPFAVSKDNGEPMPYAMAASRGLLGDTLSEGSVA